MLWALMKIVMKYWVKYNVGKISELLLVPQEDLTSMALFD